MESKIKGRQSSRTESEEVLTEGSMSFQGGFRGIKEMVDSGMNYVPAEYIRLNLDGRPLLSNVPLRDRLPIISFEGLFDSRRKQIIQEMAVASEEWGFFQIINHGIPQGVVNEMLKSTRSFFEQPARDRMIFYTDDVKKRVAYVTSFNQSKEKVRNWKDTLRFPFSATLDPELPAMCREPAFEYCQEMKILGARLYEALSESLGQNVDSLMEIMGNCVNINISLHYYPPCPDPELTLGLSGHSDPNVITVLLQDEIGGLQIMKDGEWIEVPPVPGCFIINIGDQLQILTNDKFKSVKHRVVTNATKPRLSIPTFFNPSYEATVKPLAQFVDEGHPAVYKETLYRDYVSHFYEQGLASMSILDFAKC